jgi:hypothetical protein
MPFFKGLHHKLGLCYTQGMNFDRQIWDQWAESLHRWGIRGFTASLLEAVGPLTILGAQMVYILQPLVGRGPGAESLLSLASMLEQPDQVRDFVKVLREEPTS